MATNNNIYRILKSFIETSGVVLLLKKPDVYNFRYDKLTTGAKEPMLFIYYKAYERYPPDFRLRFLAGR